ncbi:RNA polymerase sigma factor SigB [Pseudonocardia sp. Ae505_Ps2]|nr:sigma-70 family RNA polymerase sigma factor [Pseudonocardia sp. Ae505_Ps2]OLM12955.1 RNA polymerase sigma factor SigB [Pseudonocardia sp. Ae505_Ps2]
MHPAGRRCATTSSPSSVPWCATCPGASPLPAGAPRTSSRPACSAWSRRSRYDPGSATGGPLGYLVPSIRGEMKRHLRDHSWSVRVPRDLKELAVAVGRIADEMGQRLGRPPRPSEIAEQAGVSVDEVVDALGALESHHARSLDAPVGDGDGPGQTLPLVERLGGEDPALDLAAHGPGMRAALAELPERERRILVLRFYGDRTQSQIAADLGISQMHVSRLLSRTLSRLRERLTGD